MRLQKEVGIVGGEGAIDLLETFLGIGDIKINGVLDNEESSPLTKIAKKSSVFTTSDPAVFFRKMKGMTILDLSNGWYRKLVPWLNGDVRMVNAELSGLLVSCVKDRKRLIRTQSALERVSEIIVSTFDLPRILDLVIFIASRLMKVKICAVRLIDSDGVLSMAASYGLSKDYQGKGSVKVGDSIAGWVVENRKPYFSRDVRKDPKYRYAKYAKNEGITSMLCVPLIVKEKAIGSLSVYTSLSREFSPGEIRLFTAFSNQVAVVVENARLFKDIEESHLGLLEALGVVVETRDFYTADHSRDVKKYAITIARQMGLSTEETESIAYASLIHDLGKIGIEERILSKPDKLSVEEFEKVANHSKIGADIVSHIKILKHLAPLILHLHERYDGKGYPDGLKGDRIPLGSRILMVADAFSAMTSDRPYRKAMPDGKAVAELRKNAGAQFDPVVVDTFIEAYGKSGI